MDFPPSYLMSLQTTLGANFSDHSPLFHIICGPHTSVSPSLSSASSTLPKINWFKVTSADVEIYCDMIPQCLPPLPPGVIGCSTLDCSCHLETNNYSQSLMSTVVSWSLQCFPCSLLSSESLYLDGMIVATGMLRRMSVFSGQRQAVLLQAFSSTSNVMLRVIQVCHLAS